MRNDVVLVQSNTAVSLRAAVSDALVKANGYGWHLISTQRLDSTEIHSVLLFFEEDDNE